MTRTNNAPSRHPHRQTKSWNSFKDFFFRLPSKSWLLSLFLFFLSIQVHQAWRMLKHKKQFSLEWTRVCSNKRSFVWVKDKFLQKSYIYCRLSDFKFLLSLRYLWLRFSTLIPRKTYANICIITLIFLIITITTTTNNFIIIGIIIINIIVYSY